MDLFDVQFRKEAQDLKAQAGRANMIVLLVLFAAVALWEMFR